MSRLFARLGDAFVMPAPAAALDERAGIPPPAPAVAVLCRPEHATAVGGATALALAARRRSTHALLAVWRASGRASPHVPARKGARRLATTLGARGHRASATARLAIVALVDDPAEASAEAARAGAAAGQVPVVVVLAGPRETAADGLLRAQDTILVAESDATVARLAIEGLARLGVVAHSVAVPAGAAHARALAAAGVALVPPLRAAVEAGLEGLA